MHAASREPACWSWRYDRRAHDAFPWLPQNCRWTGHLANGFPKRMLKEFSEKIHLRKHNQLTLDHFSWHMIRILQLWPSPSCQHSDSLWKSSRIVIFYSVPGKLGTWPPKPAFWRGRRLLVQSSRPNFLAKSLLRATRATKQRLIAAGMYWITLL